MAIATASERLEALRRRKAPASRSFTLSVPMVRIFEISLLMKPLAASFSASAWRGVSRGGGHSSAWRTFGSMTSRPATSSRIDAMIFSCEESLSRTPLAPAFSARDSSGAPV